MKFRPARQRAVLHRLTGACLLVCLFLPAMAHALNQLTEEDTMSIIARDLGIRLAIPADWFAEEATHADRIYMASPQMGYRSSIALSLERLESPTPEAFEKLITGVPDALASRHPDLKILRQQKFMQEHMPAWFIRYQWSHDSVPHSFEQVTALIVTNLDHGSVVQVDGSTIAPLAQEYMPLFADIVNSIEGLGGNEQRDFPPPGYRTHFSYHTHASLALPVEWDPQEESGSHAIYREDIEDREEEIQRPGVLAVHLTRLAQADGSEPQKLLEQTRRISRAEQAVLSESRTTVDGRDATTITLRYRDTEHDLDLFLHQTAFLAGSMLYSLTMVAEEARKDELLPEMTRALQSLRVIPFDDSMIAHSKGDPFQTIFDERLMLSLIIPTPWTGQWDGEKLLRFYGPPQPDFDDYRPTISFQAIPVEGFGYDWLEEVIATLGRDMEEEYNQYTLVLENRFLTEDLDPAHLRRYQWVDEESGLGFSQFQVLLIANSHMYIINGATLTALERQFMPTLMDIFQSLRVIPRSD